jgi:hypothetical protein
MFIQHLTEESLKQAKLERKPRRNIQYKDVGKSTSPSELITYGLLTPPLSSACSIADTANHRQPTPSHTKTTSSSSKT